MIIGAALHRRCIWAILETDFPRGPEYSTFMCSQSMYACSCTFRYRCVYYASRPQNGLLPHSFHVVGKSFVGNTGSLVRFAESCTCSLCRTWSLKVQHLLAQCFLHVSLATLTSAASGAPALFLLVARLRGSCSEILRFVRTPG